MREDKESAIKAYEAMLAKEASTAKEQQQKLAAEAEHKQQRDITWQRTFLPLFSEEGIKVQNEYDIRLKGNAPKFKNLPQDVGVMSAVFTIQREWMVGTGTKFSPLGLVQFILQPDDKIVAVFSGVPLSTRSMEFKQPDRQWIHDVFESAMLGALSSARSQS